MSATLSYEDAIDLLDADHKLVQKLFLNYQAMAEDGAPPQAKQQLATKICQDLTVHAQIEEEIFYPGVREAIEDDSLIDEALREHAEAKETIARIQNMSPDDPEYDETIKQLSVSILDHVMEEREQIFLEARYSTADLRGMVPDLYERKKELQGKQGKRPASSKAGTKKEKS